MSIVSTDREAGMSIVEALVALFVFAMAGVGLIQLQAQSLRTLSAVEQRALADMIAQNHLVEILSTRAAPEPGEQRGQDSLGGRTWRWTARVTATADVDVLRVDVAVGEGVGEGQGSAELASAHGFVSSREARQ